MRNDPPAARAARRAFITPEAAPMTAAITNSMVVTFNRWQHGPLFHMHLPARFHVAEHRAYRCPGISVPSYEQP